MKVKNKPEPKAAKVLAHSLELNLRPIPHPVLGKREVQHGRRVHGQTDEQLLMTSHVALVQMLGYREIGWSAYAALAAEVVNQMPEEYRRLAANLIITGDAMGVVGTAVPVDGNVQELIVQRVRRYEGLAELSTPKTQALWTPGS